MKNFILFSFIIHSVFLFSQTNHVVVHGKTNVNTFKCYNNKISNVSSAYSFKSGILPNLQLDVDSFDCKNRIMTQDLRKTLKSTQYPKMFVKFLNVEKVSDQQYSAIIEVRLTDKVKTYSTSFYPVNNALVGREYVRFSDFGLKAPTKMAGMIVVEDQLNLVLTLNNQ